MIEYDDDLPIAAIPMKPETETVLAAYFVRTVKDLRAFREYCETKGPDGPLDADMEGLFAKYL